jgi:TRAP transporter TAXI family solute receptor
MRLNPKLFGLAAVSVLISLPLRAAAETPVIVPILTCPFGCGVIEGNTIFGNLMAKEGESLIIAPQETPGYMYNIQEMKKEKYWTTTIFGTEDAIVQLAMQGGSPELKEFLPEPVPIEFKLLHGEALWAQGKFFITNDPGIRTVADMKGKRISLGLRGQSDWGVFSRLILEHGYGITPENSDIRHLSPPVLTQQLIDGTTDVAVSGYGTEPSQQYHLITGFLRKLEASGKELHYVPIDQEAIDRVNEKLGTTFITKTVAAGTLPFQDEDLLIGFVRSYKVVHPDFPEDVAYRFVMAAHRYAPQMKDLNALWGMLTPEMMVDGLSEDNTHPGAIRALKELGIWEMRKNYVPVTFPGS